MERQRGVDEALVVGENPPIARSGRWRVIGEALVGRWRSVRGISKNEANYLSFG